MEMGIAALLPGFRLMRELIETHDREYRDLLAKLQNGEVLNGHTPKRGRPPKASRTMLEAVAAAELPAPAAVKALVPGKTKRKVKARRGEGKNAYKPSALPPMINGKHVVAHVAQELGYTGSWGFTLFLRTHKIPITKVKNPNGAQSVNVITPANYLRAKRIRGERGLRIPGLTAAEQQAASEMEAATR